VVSPPARAGEPARGAVRDRRIALVGYGSVGRALATLLERVAPELAARFGVRATVTLVATRTLGVLVDPLGVPAARLETAAARAARHGRPRPIADLLETLADPATPYDLLVEATTASPHDGEPAAAHIRAALASGRDAITANKGPIAWHGRELDALAVRHGARLRYEATLMDCLPVQVLRESVVPVGRIRSFRGIVNSTTNLMLSAMAAGRSPGEALEEAQRLGIAEADPRHDTEGHDAALKATILANLLLDPAEPITPDLVERKGLEGVADDWPARAARRGSRVRLVARGSDGANSASPAGPAAARPAVTVLPEELPLDDPLALVDGRSMALSVETELAGRLTAIVTEPSVEHTAYAILMDLVALERTRAAVRD